MTVSIIDYGMGNLRSVQKGFEKIGAQAKIINTAQQVADAEAVVLPGVGAFKNCLENLDSLKLITPIIKSIESGKPFLGICLGLQILFTESEEFGSTSGLDIIKGRVIRFKTDTTSENKPHLKIPHMGWNSISIKNGGPCLKNIEDETYLYFVHSYYVKPKDEKVIATTTDYGIEFVSSILKDNIFACQFHPEKSQKAGLKILENFTAASGQKTAAQ
jgi:glutamine amidotransferase